MVPDFTWLKFLMAASTCLASVTLLSASFAGWMLAPLAKWERVVLGLAALPIIAGSASGAAMGAAFAAPVLIRQFLARRADAARPS
jgi:TRAP-type uncharacterized transport system fused permease subunit